MKANGGDSNSEFKKPLSLEIYNWCAKQLLSEWAEHKEKDIVIMGQYYLTSLITNFRNPQPSLPADVERELRGDVVPDEAYYNSNDSGTVTGELILSCRRDHDWVVHKCIPK